MPRTMAQMAIALQWLLLLQRVDRKAPDQGWSGGMDHCMLGMQCLVKDWVKEIGQ